MAVIHRPLKLSGRRRQAISPHAANDPPTSRKTTCTGSIGPGGPNRNGDSAPISAATTRIHITTQKVRCRSGTTNRRSTRLLARLSAGGPVGRRPVSLPITPPEIVGVVLVRPDLLRPTAGHEVDVAGIGL